MIWTKRAYEHYPKGGAKSRVKNFKSKFREQLEVYILTESVFSLCKALGSVSSKTEKFGEQKRCTQQSRK